MDHDDDNRTTYKGGAHGRVKVHKGDVYLTSYLARLSPIIPIHHIPNVIFIPLTNRSGYELVTIQTGEINITHGLLEQDDR